MSKLHVISLFAMQLGSIQNRLLRPHFCLDAKDFGEESCPDPNFDPGAPGTWTKAYYAYNRDIAVHASITDTIEKPEDKILLVNPWVMKEGKYFHTIYLRRNKNSGKNEFMGENGSGNWLTSGTLFVKGDELKTVAMANELGRTDITLIIPKNDGGIMVVGSESHPCNLKPAFDTFTDESTEDVGWEFQIKSVDRRPWRLDPTVAIPLDPGEEEEGD